MPPAKEEEVFIMTSPNRRVVKAKTPPSTNPPPDDNPEVEEAEEDSNANVSYAYGIPSVEREVEQEKSDQWKMGRLVGMAAKQKSQRDKEVLERRQNSSTPDSTTVDVTYSVPPKVLEEFSVEPKYPDHKRSGDTVSGISEGEPQVKRRKASVDEGLDDDNDERNSISKVVVVSALVAAVAIGVTWFRRKSA